MIEKIFCVKFLKSIVCKIDDMCTKWGILICLGKENNGMMKWKGSKTHGNRKQEL